MSQGALLSDPFGLVGTVLEGNYHVDAVVGEGGFGVVYRGHHLSLDQPIAIKVLKGLDGGDPRINDLVHAKFREEARLLYRLSQSSLHIVRAVDFGASTMPSGVWAPFMILEWLEGRSLEEDIEERRARGLRGRSLAEAFPILEQVVDGLNVAHQQHVVHRDIKPANIFLGTPSRPGPPAHVKVLDFGIAKIMKEGEEAGTKGTFASFTYAYAAPEQLDPRIGATGLATDVYAFALVMTEIFTDRPPVDENDVVGIMKAATNPSRRPSPRTRGANIPDEIEAICLRALSVDPRKRYASIAELWEALSAARNAPSVSTLPPPPPAASSSPVTGRNSALPALSVATPRIAMAPTAMAQPWNAPQRPTPPPPMPTFHGYPGGPPPGTALPGSPQRLPFVRADKTSPVAAVTIVLFVLAMLLAGSCALVHGACNAMH